MDSKPSHSGSTRERAQWAVREGAVLLAVLGFWVAAFVAVLTVVGVLLFVVRTLRLEALRLAYEFLETLQRNLWAVLVPLVAANASLYVLVRAGSVLLDRYRD
jgi:hypothetical protein